MSTWAQVLALWEGSLEAEEVRKLHIIPTEAADVLRQIGKGLDQIPSSKLSAEP